MIFPEDFGKKKMIQKLVMSLIYINIISSSNISKKIRFFGKISTKHNGDFLLSFWLALFHALLHHA